METQKRLVLEDFVSDNKEQQESFSDFITCATNFLTAVVQESLYEDMCHTRDIPYAPTDKIPHFFSQLKTSTEVLNNFLQEKGLQKISTEEESLKDYAMNILMDIYDKRRL